MGGCKDELELKKKIAIEQSEIVLHYTVKPSYNKKPIPHNLVCYKRNLL